jgi:two-component system sensor histidine kinase CiaH
MFKKLKIKLTLLNLAVAGIILVAIAAIAFVLISDNIKSQSEKVLSMVANNFAMRQSSEEQLNPAYIIKSTGGIYPYGIIAIDSESKNVVSATFQGPPVSKNQDQPANVGVAMDKSQLDQVVNIVITNEENATISGKVDISGLTGTVLILKQKNDIIDLGNNNSYRYTAVYSNGYIFAIMQDMTSEKALLTNVAVTLGVSVLAGLLLLSLGGLFLAERSLRPIRVSWQKQRDFVADASHELRTPLAAIMSNIDVVLDDPGATVEEKQLYCQGISEEARRMSLLVDGLLTLARSDSDAAVFQKEPVDVAELAREAAALMQPVAGKKRTGIFLDVMQEPWVAGDSGKLKQVLLQLLDNAVKYTPEGGRIDVAVGEAKGQAVVRVADNGIGIVKEHLSKIFERFFRADSSRERETGGHGLGLAIAKFIVEQHGGTLAAESVPGKGSMFTITLPVIGAISSQKES